MPITDLHRPRRQRRRYVWYPVLEAVWALVAIAAVFALPVVGVAVESLPAPALGVFAGVGGFCATVRVVAAIADSKGGAR